MAELTKKQQEEVKEEVNKQVEKQVDKQLSKRLFEKTTRLRTEFKKQTVTALIAAFGLVIALSWQEVIKKIIADIIPKSGILLYHPYLTDLYTALVVTAVGAIAILILSRWSQSPTPPTN